MTQARPSQAFWSCPAFRLFPLPLQVPDSPACSTCRHDIPEQRTRDWPRLTSIGTQVWKINRERAVDYLNTRNRIYVVDGYAGWDEKYRIRVRVICARAYHALFMRNMLIRPPREELEGFHPDYTIYNAGSFPANRFTEGMTSATSVSINFAEKEMVILGTEYAGEMKKGVSISNSNCLLNFC
jgi:ATP-dependent phosphoenolpyruvate carboxykinase